VSRRAGKGRSIRSRATPTRRWPRRRSKLAATYTTAYSPTYPRTHAALQMGRDPPDRVVRRRSRPRCGGAALAERSASPKRRCASSVPDTGGGSAASTEIEVAEEAARLSAPPGRPVKVRWNREEEFTLGHLRPAALIDVRTAPNRDGTSRRWELRKTTGVFGAVGHEIPNQRTTSSRTDSPLSTGPVSVLAARRTTSPRIPTWTSWRTRWAVDPLELRLRHLRDERLAEGLRVSASGWTGAGRARARFRGWIAGGVEKGARVATAWRCASARTGASGSSASWTTF